MKIERAAVVHNQLGEGPVWDSAQQRLYWVDATGNSYLSLDPFTNALEQHTVGTYVICVALCDDSRLLIATKNELIFWDQQTMSAEHILDGPFDINRVRFNDGKVDPAGRFFIGTMHIEETEPRGGLFRLSGRTDFTQIEWNVTTSNGLGWNSEGTHFYYTDSIRKAIYRYDYDRNRGMISNRILLVDSNDENGVPDGLSVDGEGCIWSARWNGWRVTRYDPEGRKMTVLQMPVAKPTSCTFGGPDLRDLYITTARHGLDANHLSNYPETGNLFVCHTDVRGQVERRFLCSSGSSPEKS